VPVRKVVRLGESLTTLGNIQKIALRIGVSDFPANLGRKELCCRAVIPGMVARTSGRVINVSSDVGIGSCPDGSSYACGRAALLRLTDSLAAETAGLGVSVFAISPGLVRTALTEHVLAVEPGQRWFSRLKSPNWVGPEEAAKLVLQLASGKADVLSGRYFRISDNIDDLVARAEEIKQRDVYALRVKRF